MANGRRCWCFTWFSIEKEPQYDSASMSYLCFGRETCPTTGKKHLQGFVAFKAKRSIADMKNWEAKAYLKGDRGSIAQSIERCSEGDFVEYGVLPMGPPQRLEVARKRRYDEALQYAKSGDFDKIEASILLRYFHNIQKIREDYLLSLPVSQLSRGSTVGLWLAGPPGIGMSFYALDFCEARQLSYYIKPCNKWWDGYAEEEIVILDSVDHSVAQLLSRYIKTWVDEAPFFGETKGGTVKIRPRGFIVTSNYDIETLWPDDSSLFNAISGRFKQYSLTRRDDFKTVAWDVPERMSPPVAANL